MVVIVWVVVLLYKNFNYKYLYGLFTFLCHLIKCKYPFKYLAKCWLCFYELVSSYRLKFKNYGHNFRRRKRKDNLSLSTYLKYLVNKLVHF